MLFTNIKILVYSNSSSDRKNNLSINRWYFLCQLSFHLDKMQGFHFVAFVMMILIMLSASIICSLCCYCLFKFLYANCRRQPTNIDLTLQTHTNRNTILNGGTQMEMVPRNVMAGNYRSNVDAVEVWMYLVMYNDPFIRNIMNGRIEDRYNIELTV